MNKVQIIPAILPENFGEIEEKVQTIMGYAKTVQVDICDGGFVSSLTWPYQGDCGNWDKIQTEDEGMPGWEKIDYEFDLMINNPEKHVDEWVMAGGARVIVHTESRGNVEEALKKLQGRAEVGIALNIDTDLGEIEKYKNLITFVQLMGIDKVGFQHQEFDEKVIDRVREVKKLYPELSVSVDGGVSLDNAHRLLDAGADRLVVGSAIFNAENLIDTLKEFQRMAHRGE